MISHPSRSLTLSPQLRRWQPFCIGFILVSLLCPLPVAAQQIRQATIREVLDGKQVFIQDKQAQKNDVGQEGQIVRTILARVGLLFNVNAGMRLGQKSSLTVGSKCVQLMQGEVLIAGTVGRNGCVGTIEVSPKGTVYIMKLDSQNRAQVVVLEGQVEISSTKAPETKVTVAAGQGVTTTADGNLTSTADGNVAVNSFSDAQLQTLATPFVEGFQESLPDLDRVAFLQPDITTAFLQEALGGAGGFESWDGQKSGSLSRVPDSLSFDSTLSGVFIRDSDDAGRFISTSPAATIPISINTDALTLSIGGIEGISSSAGLSGNNATGTVFLRNGEVLRLEVFGVNKKEPPIGSVLPATLGSGTARDR